MVFDSSTGFQFVARLDSKSTISKLDSDLEEFISHSCVFFLFQQTFIYKAIENEYMTDWDPSRRSSPGKRKEVQQRDRILQMLSDSQIVAPVVNIGNLHAELNHKSYFYVFNHQTEQGDYPQVRLVGHSHKVLSLKFCRRRI